MSHLTTYRNGSNPSHGKGRMDVEFLALDDKLRDEMKRLSEVNDELLGKTHSDAEVQLPQAIHADSPLQAELEELRAENAQLGARLREAEQLLEQLAGAEETWTERQKEYETLLDEKSEVIRSLHIKLKGLQEGVPAVPASGGNNDEVRRLKEEMAEQRRQLQQDEDALMQQMRQMEMAMSRDRAELARQRSEMQRMQTELNHEIENAARDPALREKLLSLQRRQQETLARKGGSSTSSGALPRPVIAAPPSKEPSADPRKSGFFGRLFGK